MKISVTEESSMDTVVTLADEDSENTIEVTEAEWQEFSDVEEHYLQLLANFRQRQASERQAAVGEIGQLRTRLAQLEARLGVAPGPAPAPARPVKASSKPHNPVSETDWGQGVGGREKPQDPQDFRDELAELRDRTTERRHKRGLA